MKEQCDYCVLQDECEDDACGRLIDDHKAMISKVCGLLEGMIENEHGDQYGNDVINSDVVKSQIQLLRGEG